MLAVQQPALLAPPPMQVRLLLGEVPERSEFTAPEMAAALGPYFDVTQVQSRGRPLPAERWAGCVSCAAAERWAGCCCLCVAEPPAEL